MPSTKPYNLSFPVGGLDTSLAYQLQPPYTTPQCLNVFSFDVFEMRGRGGSRAGLTKSFYTRLGSGSPVRLLASINSIQSDNYDRAFDSFDGTGLSSSWSQGQFSALPSIETIAKASLVAVNGTTEKGAVAAASMVTDFSATAYRIGMFILPYQGEHQGTYRIHARMDATSPASTTDGVIAEITLASGGGYSGTLKRYVGGVLTSHSLVSGSLSADLPGWFELDVSSSTTVKVYWQGILLITQTVGAAVGNRWGFSAVGSSTSSKALIDRVDIQYFRTSKYELDRSRLFASSGGLFYRETYARHLELMSVTATLQSSARVMAAELMGKLFIADWSEPLAGASDGANTTTSFDSATYSDWTSLGISTTDHGLQVVGADGVVDGDAVPISSIASGALTLSRSLKKNGSDTNCSTVTFRVVRVPKMFDPIAGTVTQWTTENYQQSDYIVQTNGTSQFLTGGLYSPSVGVGLIGTRKGVVPYGCRILARAQGRIFLSGDPTAPQAWYASRQGNARDFDYGVVSDDQAAIAGSVGQQGVIPEPITAIIPWFQDYVIFGCRSSMHLLGGNPRAGGRIQEISSSVGVVDATAWCVDEEDRLYFLARDGLYEGSPTCATCQPKKISRGKMPLELRNISNLSTEVTMRHEPGSNAIYILLSHRQPRAGVTHWKFSLDTKGLFPAEIPSTMEPSVSLYYSSVDPDEDAVLFGGRDGYIRRFHRHAETDDGIPITSYVAIGPLKLGDWLSEGMIDKVQSTMSRINPSGTVSATLRMGADPEAALTADPFPYPMTFPSGQSRIWMPKAKHAVAFLFLQGTGRPWAMNEIAVEVTKNVGVSRRDATSASSAAPTVNVPAGQSVGQLSTLTFSSANGNLISVS